LIIVSSSRSRALDGGQSLGVRCRDPFRPGCAKKPIPSICPTPLSAFPLGNKKSAQPGQGLADIVAAKHKNGTVLVQCE
jgi:hypothetical protein